MKTPAVVEQLLVSAKPPLVIIAAVVHETDRPVFLFTWSTSLN